MTGLLADVAGGAQGKAGFGGGTSASPSTCAEAVDRRSEREQLGGLVIPVWDEIANVGRSGRQCAGLIEQDGARFAERFDRPGTLDDHAETGRARKAGHQRDRRRKDQWARRGNDDDRQRPDGVAADRPREPGCDHCRGEKESGVAVRHPYERRPMRLRLLDQAHERRIRALGRRSVRTYVKR